MATTTPDFWDCECETNYIRSASFSKCNKCGAKRDECADSRVEEVIELLGIFPENIKFHGTTDYSRFQQGQLQPPDQE